MKWSECVISETNLTGEEIVSRTQVAVIARQIVQGDLEVRALPIRRPRGLYNTRQLIPIPGGQLCIVRNADGRIFYDWRIAGGDERGQCGNGRDVRDVAHVLEF